ncbi:hypothetical protein EB093_06320 [bacterium]|nr:hypothetical protein [bacterium]
MSYPAIASGWAIVILAVMVAGPVQAAVSDGTQLELLRLTAPAASLAAAETDGARTGNVAAGFHNPATGSRFRGTVVHSLHTQQSSDRDLFSLGVVQSLGGQMAWGVSWLQSQEVIGKLTSVNVATPTTDIDTISGVYSMNGLNGFLAWSIGESWDVGIAGTVFVNHLSTELGASGVGATFTPGIRTQMTPDWALGAYLDNALSTVSWDTGTTETLGRTLHLSSDYQWAGLGVGVEYLASLSRLGQGNVRWGCRGALFPALTLSLGVYPSHIACGFSVALGPVQLDYAYAGGSQDVLESGSRVTLGFRL